MCISDVSRVNEVPRETAHLILLACAGKAAGVEECPGLRSGLASAGGKPRPQHQSQSSYAGRSQSLVGRRESLRLYASRETRRALDAFWLDWPPLCGGNGLGGGAGPGRTGRGWAAGGRRQLRKVSGAPGGGRCLQEPFVGNLQTWPRLGPEWSCRPGSPGPGSRRQGRSALINTRVQVWGRATWLVRPPQLLCPWLRT